MPSVHYISKMLKLVLYRNAFEFNNDKTKFIERKLKDLCVLYNQT